MIGDQAGELIGAPRATIESARHVRGRGRFLADVRRPGMLEAAMVRSPHAHARIGAIDASAALALPGVHAVLTGPEVRHESGPIFTLAALHDPPLAIPLYGLAHDKVRHAGEAVAAVAASSRAIAEDAAELVRVEYEPLPVLIDSQAALADGAPLIHEGIAGNRIIDRRYDFGDVDGAFAKAARVVSRRLTWSRHAGVALDTFGCVAEWEPGDQGVTFWSNHQSYAFLPTLGATLGLAANRVTGMPCDIGGSFGAKFWQPRPMVVCALLSRRTGRPVRFVEDRAEHLEAGDNHGEQRTYDGELALDAEGRILAIRFRHVEDYGAALILGTIGISEPLAAANGPYDIGAIGIDFTGVLTNKTAQAAYRGLGGAALNFLIERLVDAAAAETGTSRVELRRRNLIAAESFPYRTPTGNIYDSGDYEKALDLALEVSDHSGWLERQREAREAGRAIGIGLVCCQERSVQGGGALWLMFDQNGGRASTAAETVTVRVDAGANVRVALHCPSLGTPLETVVATVAGEELGVDPDSISVSQLDTSVAGPSLGPSASRMTVMLAGAVSGAVGEIRESMRPIAAVMLNAEPGELVWDRTRAGYAVLTNPSRFVSLAQLAARASSHALALPAGSRSGLESTYTYDHPAASLPRERGDWGSFAPIVGHAVHIPIVDVDLETGQVAFLAYTVVHDCGTIINPDAVRGQVIGGVAQGIACALSEEFRYTPAGRLVERDLRSYFLPTTLDTPSIAVHHLQTPSPFTWRGVKGVGEGGRMAAPAAVISAIEDALSPYGVRIDEIPATPEKILGWIAAGGQV
jgi:CO/xanthine dehydrogenase Mo-binding subunit